MSTPSRWPRSKGWHGEIVGDARLIVRCRERRLLLVVREANVDIVVTLEGSRYVLNGEQLIAEGLGESLPELWNESPGPVVDCPDHGRHRVDAARLRSELDAWRGRTINLDLRRVAG